ncbi:hypothetical protein [Streptomyces lydicus]|uniref:hypothetical protein n=1 Tax=Streptomyces lydicus TaxID=47763 RepID=UPI00287096D3|nr:hypothetical protein [Streptomyces lydicus]
MNEAELATVIDDHCTAEAQTLTTGAEAHLLELAELRSRRARTPRGDRAAHQARRTAHI